ncbi:MAG: galactose-1-phosphate uridylyltransferase [Patescibacteria group bacterium]|jgi:UDPglucose--hexose-1-phosphate uridylyltransferase
MPRIRQNIVTGEWVVVAPERAKRPEEFNKRPFSAALLHDQECFFCVGGSAWNERLDRVGSKNIYVIPNKFPAFTKETNIEETGHDFFSDNSAEGVHEVIILSNPNDALNKISSKNLADLLQVMRDRTRFYQQDVSIRSFTPIYNHGLGSGASVNHPHAQFFGNNLVPPRLLNEFMGSEQYFHHQRNCVFCDLLTFELKENSRVVFKNDGAVAVTAYAPRFPFETWIIPTDHLSTFAGASDKTLKQVAEALRSIMKQFDQKLSNPPLNWFIHTSRSFDYHQKMTYHWHLEITPRLSTYGGYELATDMTIETVMPEIAARFLKS